MSEAPVIRQRDKLLSFHCPGCNKDHHIQHGSDFGPNWTWNGSIDQPVFSPSVLVSYDGADAGQAGAPPAVCHSFVGCHGAQPGQIVFLGDCTHALAGQVVDLPAWKQP